MAKKKPNYGGPLSKNDGTEVGDYVNVDDDGNEDPGGPSAKNAKSTVTPKKLKGGTTTKKKGGKPNKLAKGDQSGPNDFKADLVDRWKSKGFKAEK